MKSIWNVGKMKHFAVALAAGVLMMAGYSQESRADQCGGADGMGTYAELIGTSCTIGDKTFSGFTFGSQDILASAVSFSILDGVGGQWGFRFQFNLTVFAGDSKDFGIGYLVSCTNGSACIDSIHASLTGGAQNGGVASLAESYNPGTSFFLTTAGQTQYNMDFAPVTSLSITKDINVSCPRQTDCFATISLVTNTVDQVTVPEPGTLALLAAGLLGLGWVGRRRQG